MKKVVIVLGPTAVGKSDIAVNLAKKFDGEIISADSVQIFKGFDIGSAKVTEEEKCGIIHYCIDIKEPNEEFSVFDFVELTTKKIDQILKKGKLPIICGGTGLYVRALLNGYNFGGAAKQAEFREKLEKEDLDKLYQKLKEKDAKRAQEIKPNDKKRIIRALEILEFGQEVKTSKTDIDAFVINLFMDRAKLYERINKRVDIMFKKGLLREVKTLLEKGVKKDSQPMKAIGYKEVISYLDGEIDEKTMLELIKQHSRNYAKRQMTFFRSIKDAFVVDAENKDECLFKIGEKIKEWLWV